VKATAAGERSAVATRKYSLAALNGFGPQLPELIGGSADLTGSNLTYWSGSSPITSDNPGGNYIFYGVREFAMSALNNGIALHGGFIPYGGTFLMFCEYAFNALRMASLMKIRNIFVYTHDSVGVGEDGPTHQPVEQVSNLRRMPNMRLWRPCDALESAVAWQAAIERNDGPTCLIFTRQTVKYEAIGTANIDDVRRGGYVRLNCEGVPEAIVIATGSELPLAINAAKALNERGRRVRLVSMPCTQVFDAQDRAYREAVLPSAVKARVVVEAGLSEGWWRYAGASGKIIGIDTFGESAPWEVAFEHFGFTNENVAAAVEDLLADASA
jgi:transketolase